MEITLVAVASFLASFLTFYSGFGLGTVLMPIAAIFFPLPVAIALTAAVHFLHNLLKAGLLWRAIEPKIALQFGIIASLSAVPGTLALRELSQLPPLYKYSLGEISTLHIAIGVFLILFATFGDRIGKGKSLITGGLLSGFFGGLSGFQGAFRSAYLVHANLSKEAFIGTNAIIATAVDAVRLIMYGWGFWDLLASAHAVTVGAAIGSSLIGICVGMILLRKIPPAFMRTSIVLMLYLVGILMIAGII